MHKFTKSGDYVWHVQNFTSLSLYPAEKSNVINSDLFNVSWAEYKAGFNDSYGNYWLGNELLHQLTNTGRYKLRFDLHQRDTGRWFYAEYSTFRVDSEATNYTLHVDGFSGNASWNAFGSHNGMMFSTYDRDKDKTDGFNCAAWYEGGFWYSDCGGCTVNSSRYSHFFWRLLPGGGGLQQSRMWLQCK